jgi:predicted small lipoprotein YifL
MVPSIAATYTSANLVTQRGFFSSGESPRKVEGRFGSSNGQRYTRPALSLASVRMIRLLRMVSAALLMCALGACGNKGDLVKPPAKSSLADNAAHASR